MAFRTYRSSQSTPEACLQFSLADFLHQLFANRRAFNPALRRKRFGPFSEAVQGFTPILNAKGSIWFFCRLSLMSRAAYLPLPLTPCEDRSGLHRFRDYYALC